MGAVCGEIELSNERPSAGAQGSLEGLLLALGKSLGAGGNEAIEPQLERAGKTSESKICHQTRKAPFGEPKVRFEILLTKSERRAIRERANTERCSMPRWIVDAGQVGLIRESPFFG